MKSISSLLTVLFSLAVLSTTAFASDAPTLDDTTAGEFTTTAITAQAETVTDDVPAAEATEPAVMPAEPATEMPLDDVSPLLVSVSEMVIATGVANREPVEAGTVFTTDIERLYCHSRTGSIAPATITHVWYRDGERVAEIPLQVGAASSWRTWSSKAMFPAVPASWRVEIVAEDGTLLAQTDFKVE